MSLIGAVVLSGRLRAGVGGGGWGGGESSSSGRDALTFEQESPRVPCGPTWLRMLVCYSGGGIQSSVA